MWTSPVPSTASHVTNVCPIGNSLPDTGLQVSHILPRSSAKGGFGQTAEAVGNPGSVSNDWLPGQDTTVGLFRAVEIDKGIFCHPVQMYFL